jgi:hypothetical protein
MRRSDCSSTWSCVSLASTAPRISSDRFCYFDQPHDLRRERIELLFM